MSITITLTGNTSQLSTDFFPPIELGDDEYMLGLIDLQTFNSIPNVDEANNKFNYDDDKVITIPIGSYEIENINSYLRNVLENPESILSNDINDNYDGINRKKGFITLRANNNTLKCEIFSSLKIDFTHNDSIGSLLGFKKRILEPNVVHESDLPINILNVNTIQVECNIVTNAYKNGKLMHTIHLFFPTVPPGYKIVEVPSNVVYLPVNVRTISNITLKLVDQNDKLVNFRNEEIIVRLHLQKV